MSDDTKDIQVSGRYLSAAENKQRRQAIVELAEKEGLTAPQIARRLGISIARTAYALRKEGKGRGPRWAAKTDRTREIVRLRTEEGLYPAEIADRLKSVYPKITTAQISRTLVNQGCTIDPNDPAYRRYLSSRQYVGTSEMRRRVAAEDAQVAAWRKAGRSPLWIANRMGKTRGQITAIMNRITRRNRRSKQLNGE